nr:hypothetical protein Iba_chr08dCG0800 [Ipomoea batatas]
MMGVMMMQLEKKSRMKIVKKKVMLKIEDDCASEKDDKERVIPERPADECSDRHVRVRRGGVQPFEAVGAAGVCIGRNRGPPVVHIPRVLLPISDQPLYVSANTNSSLACLRSKEEYSASVSLNTNEAAAMAAAVSAATSVPGYDMLICVRGRFCGVASGLSQHL